MWVVLGTAGSEQLPGLHLLGAGSSPSRYDNRCLQTAVENKHPMFAALRGSLRSFHWDDPRGCRCAWGLPWEASSSQDLWLTRGLESTCDLVLLS